MTARRLLTLAWIVLAFLSASIRFLRFNHFSFWLDEILELYTVRDTWSGLWRSLRWQGLQAPLDYVLQKLWFSVAGGGPLHRALPAVWGVLGVLCLGRLMARRGNLHVGIVAGAFLALAPFHVRYSQEVRPYSLGMLFLAAALLSLDSYLEQPRGLVLAAFYACCLGSLYSLYLSAFVLALTAGALVTEDAWSMEPRRRVAARAFFKWSPVHALVIAAGTLPWWAVVWTGIRSAPMTTAPTLTAGRVFRYLGYFGFNPNDGYPLERQGVFFACLVVAGIVLAARTPRLRFLLVWAILGIGGIEILEQRHPTYDSIFHWLPAGMALAPLAALPIAALVRRRGTVVLGTVLAAVVAVLYARGLTRYFEAGRPDWRPLARALAARPLAPYHSADLSREQLFVENGWTQLCLAYYLVGPRWSCCRTQRDIQIANVDGDRARLEKAWRDGSDAWLVLAAGPRSPALRDWAARFPGTKFPGAELGATLRHLRR